MLRRIDQLFSKASIASVCASNGLVSQAAVHRQGWTQLWERTQGKEFSEFRGCSSSAAENSCPPEHFPLDGEVEHLEKLMVQGMKQMKDAKEEYFTSRFDEAFKEARSTLKEVRDKWKFLRRSITDERFAELYTEIGSKIEAIEKEGEILRQFYLSHK